MSLEFDSIIKQSLYSSKITSMLAQENISVTFSANAETAHFQPENRTIVFPYSATFLDTDIHELFMFHEVSHAINLPKDIDITLKQHGVTVGDVNIILDIRDERLIKEQYPGSVQTFQRGYQKLLDREFFGKKQDIRYKSFPNRLNVYAKLGIKNGAFIPMKPKEMEFYNRCMAAVTIEDVIELSQELYNLKKSFFYTKKEMMDYIKENLMEDPLFVDMDNEDQMRELEEGLNSLQEDRLQDYFDATFKESILSNAHVINFESFPKGMCQYISSKEFIGYAKEHYDVGLPLAVETVRNMRKDIRTSVDSMVRVFESHKAAQRAKLAKVSETGLVDVNKVYRYKFDDSIFRKITTLPNSKNHGYFILLDFSGSMYPIIDKVIDQLVVLTEFLRKIQVPYTVMAFGACVSMSETIKRGVFKPQPTVKNRVDYGMDVMPEFLLEVMNNQQSLADHNASLAALYHRYGFSLGGTPTGHAIMAAETLASEYFNRLKIDKKHLIIITDGEPTDTYGVRRGANTIVITDSKTKKNVITSGNNPYGYISALGQVLDYRHGIKLTTISLIPSLSERKLHSFVPGTITESEAAFFRKNRYAKRVDPYTKLPVFFTKPVDIDTDIDDFSLEDRTTSSQISRALINNMKKINKSRSFLNALAESLS